MDDSLFRTFAEERGLTFRWRTWMEGNRAYANIEVRKGGETVYTVRNNCLSDEQYVLDNVMRWAIEHFTDKPEYVISGWDHAKSARLKG